MDIFKLASKAQLRFTTIKGVLTTEQLWTLSLEQLDALAVSLQAEHEASGKKSFLTKTSVKDKTIKLMFDIVLDILNTKADEMQMAQEAQEIKTHNEKIISLIAEKQDESLKGKSIAQLKAMLK